MLGNNAGIGFWAAEDQSALHVEGELLELGKADAGEPIGDRARRDPEVDAGALRPSAEPFDLRGTGRFRQFEAELHPSPSGAVE